MAVALRDIIESSRRLVFFGGAGVSTESGIPDFRSAGGLYRAGRDHGPGAGVPPEVALSCSYFAGHPEEFFAYYRAHLLHPDARPNDAHRALASLERAGQLAAVVTQNIDGLHQAAGSMRVLELHGSVHRNYCLDCGRRYGMQAILAGAGIDEIPRCACGGMIRPDVVLYEEPLDAAVWSAAQSVIAEADTLIVGGTSLVVYPAAWLVDGFAGGNLVLINRDPTGFDDRAGLVIRAPIGETLAEFITSADH